MHVFCTLLLNLPSRYPLTPTSHPPLLPQEFLTSCPSNAFQKIAKTSADGGAVQGISMYQRGAALVIPMPKLFVIGFGATIGGYGLIAALEIVNKWRRERSGELQLATADAGSSGRVNVMGSGLAIGAFLAVSTNVRYQVISHVPLAFGTGVDV